MVDLSVHFIATEPQDWHHSTVSHDTIESDVKIRSYLKPETLP